MGLYGKDAITSLALRQKDNNQSKQFMFQDKYQWNIHKDIKWDHDYK